MLPERAGPDRTAADGMTTISSFPRCDQCMHSEHLPDACYSPSMFRCECGWTPMDDAALDELTAVTDSPLVRQMIDAVRSIRSMHMPDDSGFCPECDLIPPCPTLREVTP